MTELSRGAKRCVAVAGLMGIGSADNRRERFADARGRVPASFQILMLAGWKPAPGQPQPKRRGSAQVDLEQALNPPGAAGHPARRL